MVLDPVNTQLAGFFSAQDHPLDFVLVLISEKLLAVASIGRVNAAFLQF